MELRFLITALRRSAALVVVLALLGAAGGVAWALLPARQWAATASLQIIAPDLSTITGQQSQEAPDRYVATQIGIMGSTAIAQAVADKVPGETVTGVANAVKVSQRGTSDIVDVTAKATSADGAAQLANLLAGAYLDGQRSTISATLQGAASQLVSQQQVLQGQIAALGTAPANANQVAALESRYTQLAQSLDAVQLAQSIAPSSSSLIDPATAPRAPLPRKTAQKGAIGLGAGLVLGALAAVGVATRRPQLKTVRDVEDAFGMVVSARVPWTPSPATPTPDFDREVLKACLAVEAAPASGAAKTVLVVSVRSGSGVTTVATALAKLLGYGGHQVEQIEVLDPLSPFAASAAARRSEHDEGVRDDEAEAASVPARSGAVPAVSTVSPFRSLGAGGRAQERPVGAGVLADLGDVLGVARAGEAGTMRPERRPDIVVYDGGAFERLAPSVGLAQVVDVVVLVVAVPDDGEGHGREVLRSTLAGSASRMVLVTNHTASGATGRRAARHRKP